MHVLGSMGYGLVGLAALGLVLVWRGWRGRRVGDARYCRACDYNLTGVQNERCPECGKLRAEAGEVIGLRQCRAWLVVSGLALLLPASVVFIAVQSRWARSIEWYQHKPTWWVLRDARSPDGLPFRYPHERPFSDPPLQVRAFEELLRRESAGELSESQIRQIADAALVQVGRREGILDDATNVEAKCIEILQDRIRAGQLTDEQLASLYEESFFLSWQARPIAQLERGVPIEFDFATCFRGFGNPWVSIWADTVQVLRDGDIVAEVPIGLEIAERPWSPPRDPLIYPPLVLPEPFGVCQSLLQPVATSGPPPLLHRHAKWRTTASVAREGAYEYRLNLSIRFYGGKPYLESATTSIEDYFNGANLNRQRLLYETKRVLTAKSVVGNTLPDQFVSAVRDESLQHRVESRIAVDDVQHYSFPGLAGISARLLVKHPLPVDLVADVTIEAAGKEYAAGHIEVRRRLTNDWYADSPLWLGAPSAGSGTSTYFLDVRPWNDSVPERVNVVLVPNLSAAEKTVDITEIWGLPIRFENVPVVRKP